MKPLDEHRFYLSTVRNDCFWLGISKKVRHGMIVVGMSIENQRKIDPRNHLCSDGELRERTYFDRVVSWIGAVMLIELVELNGAEEMTSELSYRMISWSFCLSSWEIKSILFNNKTSANATCLRGEKNVTPLTAVRSSTLTKVLSLDDDHLDSSRLTIESTRLIFRLLSIHGNHQSLWSNLIKGKNRSFKSKKAFVVHHRESNRCAILRLTRTSWRSAGDRPRRWFPRECNRSDCDVSRAIVQWLARRHLWKRRRLAVRVYPSSSSTTVWLSSPTWRNNTNNRCVVQANLRSVDDHQCRSSRSCWTEEDVPWRFPERIHWESPRCVSDDSPWECNSEVSFCPHLCEPWRPFEFERRVGEEILPR